MQSTDSPEAIRNRRDASLVEAAAALNAHHGGNETPKALLTRIANSLPDLPYRPNPKEKATTMQLPDLPDLPDLPEEGPALSTAYESIVAFTERVAALNPDGPIARHKSQQKASTMSPNNYDVIPGLPAQKLEPITITSAVTQIIAQPGDGTRYRIILTECPADDLVGARQHLLSVNPDTKGHSMFLTMNYREIRDGGFYLHPTYIEEKFGPGSTYLSKIVAHTMNLLFSKTYITILTNLLSLPTEERDCLPPVFQTDQAIKAEIAHPHAIWNSPAE